MVLGPGHIVRPVLDGSFRVHLHLGLAEAGIVGVEHLENDPVARLQRGVLAVDVGAAAPGDKGGAAGTDGGVLDHQLAALIALPHDAEASADDLGAADKFAARQFVGHLIGHIRGIHPGVVEDIVAVADGIGAVAVAARDGNVTVLGVDAGFRLVELLGGGDAVGGQNAPAVRGDLAAFKHGGGVVLHIDGPGGTPAAGDIGHAGLAGPDLVDRLDLLRGAAHTVDGGIFHDDLGGAACDDGVVADAPVADGEVFKDGLAVAAGQDARAQALFVRRGVAGVFNGQFLHGVLAARDDQVVEALAGGGENAAGEVVSRHCAAHIGGGDGVGLYAVFSQQHGGAVGLRGIAGPGVHSLDGGGDVVGDHQVDGSFIDAGNRVPLDAIYHHGQELALRRQQLSLRPDGQALEPLGALNCRCSLNIHLIASFLSIGIEL